MHLAHLLVGLLFGVAVAPALLGGTAGAAPPPESLCAVCGDRLEGATDSGTLDVYVEADGDSTWVERVPVDESAAARYREDPDRLERAVDDAWRRYHAADGDVTDRSVALDGAVVEVTYTVADLARPAVGDTWLVDYFAVGESNGRYAVVAERVAIHPPEAFELTTTPAGATVEDGAATWRGAEGIVTPWTTDRAGDDFHEQTYLTYGPGDGVVATATGLASITLETGPMRLRHAALGGLLPAAIIGAAAIGIGRAEASISGGSSTPGTGGSIRSVGGYIGGVDGYIGAVVGYIRGVGGSIPGIAGSISGIGHLDRRLRALETDRLGRLVVGFGLMGAVVALVLGTLQAGTALAPGAVALAAAALCYATVAGLILGIGDRLGLWGLVGVAVAGALGAAGLTALVVGWPFPPTPIAFTLSAAAFLPLGFALERDDARWPALALALAPPFALVAAVAPVGVFTRGPFAVGVLLVPAALVAAGVGYPLSILGRRVGAASG